MDTETMIRELERVEEKHKHDKVFTGQLDVAKMAHDTRKRLEELKPYEDTGLTPEQIISIATELKEYKQLELSPKRLSEHVAFCRRYRELFGTIDFSRLMELKERDTAKMCKQSIFDHDSITCVCGSDMDKDVEFMFCPWCGQRLKKWEE